MWQILLIIIVIGAIVSVLNYFGKKWERDIADEWMYGRDSKNNIEDFLAEQSRIHKWNKEHLKD